MTECILSDKKIEQISKLSSIKVENEELRKRAFVLSSAAYSLAKFLKCKEYNVSSKFSLFKVPAVAQNIEIADLYIDNAKIDVRIVFDDEKFYIPKSHKKYSAEPDFYIVLQADKDLKKFLPLGFCAPSDLADGMNEDEYYSFPIKDLKPMKSFKKALKSIKKREEHFGAEEHQKISELTAAFFDDEISESEKVFYIKHICACEICRERVCDFSEFETIIVQAKNYPELLEDSTLDVLTGSSIAKDIEQASKESEFLETDITPSLFDMVKDISATAAETSAIAAGAGAVAASLEVSALSELAEEGISATGEALSDSLDLLAEAETDEAGEENSEEISAVESETVQEDIPEDLSLLDEIDDTNALIAEESPILVEETEINEDISDLTSSGEPELIPQESKDETDNIAENDETDLMETADLTDLSLEEEPAESSVDSTDLSLDELSESVEKEEIQDNLEAIAEELPSDEISLEDLTNESEDISVSEADGIAESENIESLEVTEEPVDLLEETSLDVLTDTEEIHEEPVHEEESGILDEIHSIEESDTLILEEHEEELLLTDESENAIEDTLLSADETVILEEMPVHPESEEILETTHEEATLLEENDLDVLEEAEELHNEEELSGIEAPTLESTIDIANESAELLSEGTDEEIISEVSAQSINGTESAEYNPTTEIEIENDILIENTLVTEEADVTADVENPVYSGIELIDEEKEENEENEKPEKASESEIVHEESLSVQNTLQENATEAGLSDLADISELSDTENVTPSPEVNPEIQELLDDELLQLLSADDQTEPIPQEDPIAGMNEGEGDSIGSLFENNEESAVNENGETVLELPKEPISETTAKMTKKIITAAVLLLLVAAGGITAFYLKSNKSTDEAILPDLNNPAQGNSPLDLNVAKTGENAQPEPPLAQDLNKSMTNVFSEQPAAITITKISWEVSQKLAVEDTFKNYLQVAGKNLQINLQNDLAYTTDPNYNPKVKVSFEVGKDNGIKRIQVTESSGSEQIDNVVLQSIKETLKYINVPDIKDYNGNYNLSVVINF